MVSLFFLFLRLGLTAFGGPVAHIAMMQNEVVNRRAWLTQEEFLDLIGATNLIPGPNSTEMAMHIGYRQAGFRGLCIAGCSFILPAAIIVTIISYLYKTYSSLPQVIDILYGIKPIIIAIILQAIFGLSKTALRTNFLNGLFAFALISSFCVMDEIFLLLSAGTISLIWSWWKNKNTISIKSIYIAILCTTLWAIKCSIKLPAWQNFGQNPTLLNLFCYFFKIGSVLYGSGYVLIAFLRQDLVHDLNWLTSTQLLDATAIGQITPGPVFTTATFIGFILHGLSGAIVSTIGIFLPAFIFVALSAPFLHRLLKAKAIRAFLDGVNIGALSLMIYVTWQLASVAITSPLFLLLAILSLLLLWRFNVNATWLILLGALIGLLISHKT